MVDEVGPNDPNRGRSSIGGFKLPGSKPIAVRGLDDIYTASFGGFRKPKPKEEYTQGSPDISGGGYTPAQTGTDRHKFLALFLGVPVLFLAVAGVLGYLVLGGVPTPLASDCGPGGYTATYSRSDFHREAASAVFRVEFVDVDGSESYNVVSITLPESVEETVTFDVLIMAPPGAVPVTCEVTSVELSDEVDSVGIVGDPGGPPNR